MLERGRNRVRIACANDDGRSAHVALVQDRVVADLAQHERVDLLVIDPDSALGNDLEILALDRDLGDADPGRSEPPFSHNSTVSPGSGARISTSGACRLSSSGRPVWSGNVA